MSHATRESWLEAASSMLLRDLIGQVTAVRADLRVKISVGFAPNTRTKGGKVVAICYPSSFSSGGSNEIFVSPEIDDAITVLGALLHELIHAVDDCAHAHHGPYAKIAYAVGLQSPLKTLSMTPDLADYLELLAGDLGPLPHAKMELSHIK